MSESYALLITSHLIEFLLLAMYCGVIPPFVYCPKRKTATTLAVVTVIKRGRCALVAMPSIGSKNGTEN